MSTFEYKYKPLIVVAFKEFNELFHTKTISDQFKMHLHEKKEITYIFVVYIKHNLSYEPRNIQCKPSTCLHWCPCI